ncbi:putative N-formylglutamate amidohydrolase [Pararhizobium capsulatum DSM 1112]|uniref:N-formylglutamate amidohydrolase n=1 Tax=Pararhizobium capsulatum DSM 1112 TaxID=1121113 RepID=A0ABU0BVX3_9HYPH|nr:N-formylglutamate amidohydrolase [Pararhizobium capsulatum]MDQ0321816.1 putative N-formylglutamate amidohydrolase [Pararhizobium capsulatum DSM 1112]
MQDDMPFEIIDGDTTRGLVLLADHATNKLPPEYGSLGLPASAFERHIAYDIGIEKLTQRLAQRLGVPAVMSRFSRLLIDPNRGEDDPTLIMKISDGAIISGNHPITPEESDARLNRFHRPYHRAVSQTIARVGEESGKAPLVISLHSYTPAWKGVPRSWHAAVLWDGDPRAVHPLIQALQAPGDVMIGNNEPYDGALRGDTMYRHCMETGLAHALLEVRQDLISDDDGVAAWEARLAPILEEINARAELHVVKRYPSRTGDYAFGNQLQGDNDEQT